MLRQFKDVSLFSELNGVIQKLEDKIFRESKDQSPIIHLDKNELLLGLEHLDTIYQAILKKMVLKISYQSFSAKKPWILFFTAFILKEYNNRWFVVGKKEGGRKIMTLALDRIIDISLDISKPYIEEEFDPDRYYQNTIGVTVLREEEIINIELRVDKSNAPYIMTKPFHPSQEMIGEYPDGAILIKLRVHHNYELERLILGFGESITVLKPERLKERIKQKMELAYSNYNET